MRHAAPWMLLATSVLLVASSVAHAFLGWPAVRSELARTNASGELTDTLAIGWLYGSGAMLAFGAIVLVVWWSVRAGDHSLVRVLVPISALYLVFGGAAFVYAGAEPHFIGFIVLGAVAGSASYAIGGRRTPSEGTQRA